MAVALVDIEHPPSTFGRCSYDAVGCPNSAGSISEIHARRDALSCRAAGASIRFNRLAISSARARTSISKI